MHLIDIGAMTPMKEARAFTVILMPVFRDTSITAASSKRPLKEMMGGSRRRDIKYLGYLGDRRRALHQQDPVRKIEGHQGLKIRTPEVAAIRGVQGVRPARRRSRRRRSTALQTGLVDGQENGIVDVVAAGWIEVQKYYMSIDYQQSGIGVWMSGAKWSSLTDQQKGWLLEAAKKAGIEGAAAYQKELADAIAAAKKKGMEFIDTDKSGFIKASEPMVKEKEGTVWPKGLVEKIQAIK